MHRSSTGLGRVYRLRSANQRGHRPSAAFYQSSCLVFAVCRSGCSRPGSAMAPPGHGLTEQSGRAQPTVLSRVGVDGVAGDLTVMDVGGADTVASALDAVCT